MSTLEAQDHSMTESPKLTKMQYLKKHWVMVIAFIIVLVSILWILKVLCTRQISQNPYPIRVLPS
ncbi:hypothetical protein B9X49_05980 [Acinetobacter baumannii]